MNRFFTLFEHIQGKMKIGGAACLSGMVVLTCIDVVGRLFDSPIFGVVEIVTLLATLTIALTLPYAHKEQTHIGVEIIVRLFSKKTRKIIKLCTDIIALCLFAIVTWRMLIYARTIKECGEVSMNLELPEFMIIYILAFCFSVFGIFILKDIIIFFSEKGEKK